MDNFGLNFSHFRCHGNRGRSEVNANDASKLLDLENPFWCNICGSIFCISRVLAIFMLKFPNFRYHGNQGRTDVNFNDNSKLPDLKNHLFGATDEALFLVLAEF